MQQITADCIDVLFSCSRRPVWYLTKWNLIFTKYLVFLENDVKNCTNLLREGIPQIFGSSMTLQRDKIASFWGYDQASSTVTVTFNGQRLSSITDSKGIWAVQLPPMVFPHTHTHTHTHTHKLFIPNKFPARRLSSLHYLSSIHQRGLCRATRCCLWWRICLQVLLCIEKILKTRKFRLISLQSSYLSSYLHVFKIAFEVANRIWNWMLRHRYKYIVNEKWHIIILVIESVQH